jgi:hypothetical protein
MPRVVFTPQLRRFTETPTVDSGATTLRAALEDAFAMNPRLRGYVLDECQTRAPYWHRATRDLCACPPAALC